MSTTVSAAATGLGAIGLEPEAQRPPARTGRARHPLLGRWRRGPRRRRRVPEARARHDAGRRGRVGVGQDRAESLGDGVVDRLERQAVGRGPLRRPRPPEARAQGAAQAVGHRDGDGLPGPDDLAEPGDEDRSGRSASRCASTSGCPRAKPGTPRSPASHRSASPLRSAASNEYPHQLSGACASGSRSPSRSPADPSCSSPTSPPPPSTSRSRRRSSTCWRTSSAIANMGMILVTHDLGVVAGRADVVAVMYAGQVVELARTADLFARVRMPYTEALLRAIPKLEEASHTKLNVISGRPPDLLHPPTGCRFAARCPYVEDLCRTKQPPLVEAGTPGHFYRCWFPVNSPTVVEGAKSASPKSSSARSEGNRRTRAAVPRTHQRRARPTPSNPRRTTDMTGPGTAHLRDTALLQVEHLTVEFPAGRGRRVHAVTDLSLDIETGRDARAGR